MKKSDNLESDLKETQIVESWQVNARPWINAIAQKQIASRNRVTNQAICNVVTRLKPKMALDIGCGEGWLTRYLLARGINTVGIDGSYKLIQEARSYSKGEFYCLKYDRLAQKFVERYFDIAIANFSLFGESSVENLLKYIPTKLTSSGSLVIQTLHPKIACGNLPYRDGWRNGSWVGFSSDFTSAFPWYFRTVESWISLISRYGMNLTELIEPIDPATGKAASIIFIAK